MWGVGREVLKNGFLTHDKTGYDIFSVLHEIDVGLKLKSNGFTTAAKRKSSA